VPARPSASFAISETDPSASVRARANVRSRKLLFVKKIQSSSQAEVRRSTTIPIASGERAFRRFDFQDLLERCALAAAHPDVARAHGVTEDRRQAGPTVVAERQDDPMTRLNHRAFTVATALPNARNAGNVGWQFRPN
jgi:L-alanine-DL-glutamate epimerase-like enolase superfamily enzyme